MSVHRGDLSAHVFAKRYVRSMNANISRLTRVFAKGALDERESRLTRVASFVNKYKKKALHLISVQNIRL